MKSSEVCTNTRSPPASLPIQGQVIIIITVIFNPLRSNSDQQLIFCYNITLMIDMSMHYYVKIMVILNSVVAAKKDKF